MGGRVPFFREKKMKKIPTRVQQNLVALRQGFPNLMRSLDAFLEDVPVLDNDAIANFYVDASLCEGYDFTHCAKELCTFLELLGYEVSAPEDDSDTMYQFIVFEPSNFVGPLTKYEDSKYYREWVKKIWK